MTIEQFKILHKKFSNLPLPKEVWNTPEYDNYSNAIHENKQFYEWTLKEKLNNAKFEHRKYCCLKMADNIFESFDKDGNIKYDNRDVIINEWKDGTIGIPIHDGGTSIIEIDYCPWCGTKLNKSQ